MEEILFLFQFKNNHIKLKLFEKNIYAHIEAIQTVTLQLADLI